ncbi:hypothetical protein I546_1090 [Mycobacterium kansasii 732]|nr:hypothetical protein I546_1090 [Mycobacterium kansasii 732]
MKGLGIAAGAKRPGAKKATPAAAAPEPAAPGEPETEPESESGALADADTAPPAAPVKGLGIAPGARPPGKR